VNQFAVSGTKMSQRPDLMAFVNGLPPGIIELKNPAESNADAWNACQPPQTNKDEVASATIWAESRKVKPRFGSPAPKGPNPTAHGNALGIRVFPFKPCSGGTLPMIQQAP
jgi:hypothetical protein